MSFSPDNKTATYLISDFQSATEVDIEQLSRSIVASAITVTLQYINSYDDGGKFDIVFEDALTDDDKTLLTSIVSVYTFTLYGDTVIFTYTVAPGTNGGSMTGNTWTVKPLNTTTGNVTFATRASNQITLESGNYLSVLTSHVCGVGNHLVRLRNVTDSTYTYGAAAFAGLGENSFSTLFGFINITAQKVFEVQHIGENTSTTVGLGKATSFTNETYTRIMIRKTA